MLIVDLETPSTDKLHKEHGYTALKVEEDFDP